MPENRRFYRAKAAAFLSMCVSFHLTDLSAGVSSLWGDLQAGPYSPGFTTVETYDASRTFQRKTDYFGNLMQGERARPIQICVWYPSEDTARTPTMVFGEYSFPSPQDDRFVGHLSGLQYREIPHLHILLNNNRGLVQDLMNVRMSAVRDARPESGPFPLIIYHPALQGSYSENAVLCEYLASHGFVVATTHSVGAADLNPAADIAGLETLVRDKEFVISRMYDEPYVDRNRLGVMGFGHGGSTSLLMQMRNSDVDAAVSLEGSFISGAGFELTRQNPFYDAGKVQVPFLNIYDRESEQLDLSVIDSFKCAPRYSCGLDGVRRSDFTHYGSIVRLLMPVADSVPHRTSSAYNAICRHILDFFKAYLDDDEACLQRLMTSPDDDSTGRGLFSCTYTAGEDIPPTEAQLVSIIEEYGVDTAMRIVLKFRNLSPGRALFREATFNELGYQFLRMNRVPDAVEVLRMNTAAYPGSANVWDSFAEACVAAGDTATAVASLKKALEIMPQDTTTDEHAKEVLRNNIPETLRRLQE